MASGFNNSFEKAFNPGMAVGANAALETMKEKIKKNDEERQSSAIFDLIHSKVVENAVQNGADENALKDIEKKISGLKKAGLAPSEAMSAGKLMAPDAFQDDLSKAIKEQTLVTAQMQPEMQDQKQFQTLLEKNNPLKASSRSGLGMAANATQRADRALVLLDNSLLTNQDLAGIVGDYAGILQGGAPTVEGMSSANYTSAQQSLKGMAQFATGNPQDAVPAKFKEHIRSNLNELKSISDGYITKNFDAVEKGNSRLISKYSDDWKNFRSEWSPKGVSSKPNTPPSFDPKTEKLQQNSKGEYRVVKK